MDISGTFLPLVEAKRKIDRRVNDALCFLCVWCFQYSNEMRMRTEKTKIAKRKKLLRHRAARNQRPIDQTVDLQHRLIYFSSFLLRSAVARARRHRVTSIVNRQHRGFFCPVLLLANALPLLRRLECAIRSEYGGGCWLVGLPWIFLAINKRFHLLIATLGIRRPIKYEYLLIRHCTQIRFTTFCAISHDCRSNSHAPRHQFNYILMDEISSGFRLPASMFCCGCAASIAHDAAPSIA